MCAMQITLTKEMEAIVERLKAADRQTSAAEALRRYEASVKPESSDEDPVEVVAAKGIEAIQRGEFRIVNGPEESRALHDELLARAKNRQI